jgi:hypothetical protein
VLFGDAATVELVLISCRRGVGVTALILGATKTGAADGQIPAVYDLFACRESVGQSDRTPAYGATYCGTSI